MALAYGSSRSLEGSHRWPLAGSYGPVHPVAVALAGLDAGQVPVPHVGVDLGELDALLGVVVVEQAQLDALGDVGVEGEVGA